MIRPRSGNPLTASKPSNSLERYEELVSKWEELTRRFDALLTKWEQKN